MWLLSLPAEFQLDPKFARFNPRDLEARHCELCERPVRIEVASNAVAVDQGEPRKLGDWSWSPLSPSPLVSPRLQTALAGFEGFSFAPIKVLDRWISRSTGSPGAPIPAAWLDELQQHAEFRVEATAPLQWQESSVTWAGRETDNRPLCPRCGLAVVFWGRQPPRVRPWTVVIGKVERASQVVQVVEDGAPRFSVDRKPLTAPGAVFSASDLRGADLWRMQGDARGILCNDRFKAAVEGEDATNIEFLEVGRIRA